MTELACSRPFIGALPSLTQEGKRSPEGTEIAKRSEEKEEMMFGEVEKEKTEMEGEQCNTIEAPPSPPHLHHHHNYYCSSSFSALASIAAAFPNGVPLAFVCVSPTARLAAETFRAEENYRWCSHLSPSSSFSLYVNHTKKEKEKEKIEACEREKSEEKENGICDSLRATPMRTGMLIRREPGERDSFEVYEARRMRRAGVQLGRLITVYHDALGRVARCTSPRLTDQVETGVEVVVDKWKEQQRQVEEEEEKKLPERSSSQSGVRAAANVVVVAPSHDCFSHGPPSAAIASPPPVAGKGGRQNAPNNRIWGSGGASMRRLLAEEYCGKPIIAIPGVEEATREEVDQQTSLLVPASGLNLLQSSERPMGRMWATTTTTSFTSHQQETKINLPDGDAVYYFTGPNKRSIYIWMDSGVRQAQGDEDTSENEEQKNTNNKEEEKEKKEKDIKDKCRTIFSNSPPPPSLSHTSHGTRRKRRKEASSGMGNHEQTNKKSEVTLKEMLDASRWWYQRPSVSSLKYWEKKAQGGSISAPPTYSGSFSSRSSSVGDTGTAGASSFSSSPSPVVHRMKGGLEEDSFQLLPPPPAIYVHLYGKDTEAIPTVFECLLSPPAVEPPPAVFSLPATTATTRTSSFLPRLPPPPIPSTILSSSVATSSSLLGISTGEGRGTEKTVLAPGREEKEGYGVSVVQGTRAAVSSSVSVSTFSSSFVAAAPSSVCSAPSPNMVISLCPSSLSSSSSLPACTSCATVCHQPHPHNNNFQPPHPDHYNNQKYKYASHLGKNVNAAALDRVFGIPRSPWLAVSDGNNSGTEAPSSFPSSSVSAHPRPPRSLCNHPHSSSFLQPSALEGAEGGRRGKGRRRITTTTTSTATTPTGSEDPPHATPTIASSTPFLPLGVTERMIRNEQPQYTMKGRSVVAEYMEELERKRDEKLQRAGVARGETQLGRGAAEWKRKVNPPPPSDGNTLHRNGHYYHKEEDGYDDDAVGRRGRREEGHPREKGEVVSSCTPAEILCGQRQRCTIKSIPPVLEGLWVVGHPLFSMNLGGGGGSGDDENGKRRGMRRRKEEKEKGKTKRQRGTRKGRRTDGGCSSSNHSRKGEEEEKGRRREDSTSFSSSMWKMKKEGELGTLLVTGGADGRSDEVEKNENIQCDDTSLPPYQTPPLDNKNIHHNMHVKPSTRDSGSSSSSLFLPPLPPPPSAITGVTPRTSTTIIPSCSSPAATITRTLPFNQEKKEEDQKENTAKQCKIVRTAVTRAGVGGKVLPTRLKLEKKERTTMLKGKTGKTGTTLPSTGKMKDGASSSRSSFSSSCSFFSSFSSTTSTITTSSSSAPPYTNEEDDAEGEDASSSWEKSLPHPSHRRCTRSKGERGKRRWGGGGDSGGRGCFLKKEWISQLRLLKFHWVRVEDNALAYFLGGGDEKEEEQKQRKATKQAKRKIVEEKESSSDSDDSCVERCGWEDETSSGAFGVSRPSAASSVHRNDNRGKGRKRTQGHESPHFHEEVEWEEEEQEEEVVLQPVMPFLEVCDLGINFHLSTFPLLQKATSAPPFSSSWKRRSRMATSGSGGSDDEKEHVTRSSSSSTSDHACMERRVNRNKSIEEEKKEESRKRRSEEKGSWDPRSSANTTARSHAASGRMMRRSVRSPRLPVNISAGAAVALGLRLIPIVPLRHLRLLHLQGTSISSPGVLDLIGLSCPALESLYLGNCPRVLIIEPLGCLPVLRQLDIHSTAIRNDGMRGFGVPWSFPALEELSLAGCAHVSDISPLGKLQRLKQLDLRGVPVRQGWGSLAGCPCLEKLWYESCSALPLQYFPEWEVGMGGGETEEGMKRRRREKERNKKSPNNRREVPLEDSVEENDNHHPHEDKNRNEAREEIDVVGRRKKKKEGREEYSVREEGNRSWHQCRSALCIAPGRSLFLSFLHSLRAVTFSHLPFFTASVHLQALAQARTKLQRLCLLHLPALTSLTPPLCHFPTLQSLYLEDLPRLTADGLRGVGRALATSLRRCTFIACPLVHHLDGLWGAKSLRYLEYRDGAPDLSYDVWRGLWGGREDYHAWREQQQQPQQQSRRELEQEERFLPPPPVQPLEPSVETGVREGQDVSDNGGPYRLEVCVFPSRETHPSCPHCPPSSGTIRSRNLLDLPPLSLLPHLQIVDLRGRHIGDAGVSRFGHCRDGDGGSRNDDVVQQRQRRGPPFAFSIPDAATTVPLPSLHTLYLCNCSCLTRANSLMHLPRLHQLDLSKTSVTDCGISSLAAAPALRILLLQDCPQLSFISPFSPFPHLEVLDISSNPQLTTSSLKRFFSFSPPSSGMTMMTTKQPKESNFTLPEEEDPHGYQEMMRIMLMREAATETRREGEEKGKDGNLDEKEKQEQNPFQNPFPNLQELYLSRTSVDSITPLIGPFSSFPRPASTTPLPLRVLDLSSTNITAEGLEHIEEFSQLQRFLLSNAPHVAIQVSIRMPNERTSSSTTHSPLPPPPPPLPVATTTPSSSSTCSRVENGGGGGADDNADDDLLLAEKSTSLILRSCAHTLFCHPSFRILDLRGTDLVSLSLISTPPPGTFPADFSSLPSPFSSSSLSFPLSRLLPHAVLAESPIRELYLSNSCKRCTPLPLPSTHHNHIPARDDGHRKEEEEEKGEEKGNDEDHLIHSTDGGNHRQGSSCAVPPPPSSSPSFSSSSCPLPLSLSTFEFLFPLLLDSRAIPHLRLIIVENHAHPSWGDIAEGLAAASLPFVGGEGGGGEEGAAASSRREGADPPPYTPARLNVNPYCPNPSLQGEMGKERQMEKEEMRRKNEEEKKIFFSRLKAIMKARPLVSVRLQ